MSDERYNAPYFVPGAIAIAGLIWIVACGKQSPTPPDPSAKPTSSSDANGSTTKPKVNEVPKNSNDPLLKAIREKGDLKAALETLKAKFTFDAENYLTHLSLDEVEVTDDALIAIGKQTKLEALYLFNTKITDAGLKPLEGLASLRILYLPGTGVTFGGVAALEKALPQCVVLH